MNYTVPIKFWLFSVRQLLICVGVYSLWNYFLPGIASNLTLFIEANGFIEAGLTNLDKGKSLILLEFPFLIVLSALLASIIAYHPLVRLKMETMVEIEAPKSHILYAIAGTIIGVLVTTFGPEVGFIIFGLGGLFRFRTDVGPSKETGRILLSTLIGLICGLGMPEVGFVTTIMVFFIVYSLERHITYRLYIRGLDGKPLEDLALKYREALKLKHCIIFSERKNPLKSQIEFVFQTRDLMVRSELEEFFQTVIPVDEQGMIDLETN